MAQVSCSRTAMYFWKQHHWYLAGSRPGAARGFRKRLAKALRSSRAVNSSCWKEVASNASSNSLPIGFCFCRFLMDFFIFIYGYVFCGWINCSPPARWRSLDFIKGIRGASRLPLPSAFRLYFHLRLLNCELVGAAGPQPRGPDLSGHCRTPTTRARSQWALPGPNCESQMAHRMSVK